MIFDYEWIRREVEDQIDVVVAEPDVNTWLVVRIDEDHDEVYGIVQQVLAMEGPNAAVTLRIWVTEDQQGHDDLARWLMTGGNVELRLASEEELASAIAGADRGVAE